MLLFIDHDKSRITENGHVQSTKLETNYRGLPRDYYTRKLPLYSQDTVDHMLTWSPKVRGINLTVKNLTKLLSDCFDLHLQLNSSVWNLNKLEDTIRR